MLENTFWRRSHRRDSAWAEMADCSDGGGIGSTVSSCCFVSCLAASGELLTEQAVWYVSSAVHCLVQIPFWIAQVPCPLFFPKQCFLHVLSLVPNRRGSMWYCSAAGSVSISSFSVFPVFFLEGTSYQLNAWSQRKYLASTLANSRRDKHLLSERKTRSSKGHGIWFSFSLT